MKSKKLIYTASVIRIIIISHVFLHTKHCVTLSTESRVSGFERPWTFRLLVIGSFDLSVFAEAGNYERRIRISQVLQSCHHGNVNLSEAIMISATRDSLESINRFNVRSLKMLSLQTRAILCECTI